MADNIKISQLQIATEIAESDLFLLSKKREDAEGYSSKSVTAADIALTALEVFEWVDILTQLDAKKTIINTLNNLETRLKALEEAQNSSEVDNSKDSEESDETETPDETEEAP